MLWSWESPYTITIVGLVRANSCVKRKKQILISTVLWILLYKFHCDNILQQAFVACSSLFHTLTPPLSMLMNQLKPRHYMVKPRNLTAIIILKLHLSVCLCACAFVRGFSGGRVTSTLWSPLQWATEQAGSNDDGATECACSQTASVLDGWFSGRARCE